MTNIKLSSIEVNKYLIYRSQTIVEDAKRDIQFVYRTFLCADVFLDHHHIIFDANIVNHKPLIFIIEHTIYAGDGLDKNEGVPLQKIVNVHARKGRHVKSSDLHIHNNGNFEIGVIVLELPIEHFEVFFCAASLE